MPNPQARKYERGQTIVLFAFGIVFLVLATGLAIDAGLCYVAKSKLSTSVDGATLAGMKTLQQGQSIASTIAADVFYANYGANPPTPTVTFPTDASGNQEVQVTATTNVHTLFMKILPSLTTVAVSDTAVATRAKLIMTIVVDRSGSMCGGTDSCQSGVSGDDGGEALQAAVPLFVANFDQTPNTGDEIGLVSFSDNAVINYGINYSFITPIDNAISGMSFVGGTFGTGAGTGTLLSNTVGPPLSLAGAENDSVSISSGQAVIKVIVYLTDGLMNTVQDQFQCGGKNNTTYTLLNYGGFDNPGASQYGDIFNPNSATQIYGTATASGFPYSASPTNCVNSSGVTVTTFTSQQPGKGQLSFLQTNITGEAQYRAKQTAIALESESQHPNYIYTIGLSNSVTSCTEALLATIANDPNAPSYSCPSSPGVYNSNQATGEFFYISSSVCPGTGNECNEAVEQVFNTIAAKVLLRLTQ